MKKSIRSMEIKRTMITKKMQEREERATAIAMGLFIALVGGIIYFSIPL